MSCGQYCPVFSSGPMSLTVIGTYLMTLLLTPLSVAPAAETLSVVSRTYQEMTSLEIAASFGDCRPTSGSPGSQSRAGRSGMLQSGPQSRGSWQGHGGHGSHGGSRCVVMGHVFVVEAVWSTFRRRSVFRAMAVAEGGGRASLSPVLALTMLVTLLNSVSCDVRFVSSAVCNYEPRTSPTSIKCDMDRTDSVRWK